MIPERAVGSATGDVIIPGTDHLLRLGPRRLVRLFQ